MKGTGGVCRRKGLLQAQASFCMILASVCKQWGCEDIRWRSAPAMAPECTVPPWHLTHPGDHLPWILPTGKMHAPGLQPLEIWLPWHVHLSRVCLLRPFPQGHDVQQATCLNSGFSLRSQGSVAVTETVTVRKAQTIYHLALYRKFAAPVSESSERIFSSI